VFNNKKSLALNQGRGVARVATLVGVNHPLRFHNGLDREGLLPLQGRIHLVKLSVFSTTDSL